MYKFAIEARVPNNQDGEYNWDAVRKAVTWPLVPRVGEYLNLDLDDFPIEYEVKKVFHNFPFNDSRALIVVVIYIERKLYEYLRQDKDWSGPFTDDFECM
jgi:hypothetical protein